MQCELKLQPLRSKTQSLLTVTQKVQSVKMSNGKKYKINQMSKQEKVKKMSQNNYLVNFGGHKSNSLMIVYVTRWLSNDHHKSWGDHPHTKKNSTWSRDDHWLLPKVIKDQN